MRIGAGIAVRVGGGSGGVMAPPPTLSAITPSSGPAVGGTSVTNLAGTGFITGATVTVGGASATSVVVVSSIKITCTTPSGTAGASNVVVTNPDTQTSGTSGNGLYTYTFTPADLALTGWWRNYTGAPWNGTASAGVSADGSHDMVTAAVDPGIGTLNSQGTATCNGSQGLVLEGTFDSYGNATAYSGWALVNWTSGNGNILNAVTGGMNVGINTSNARLIDGTTGTNVVKAISASTWSMITWRYNGTNMQVGINGDPGASGGGSTAAYSTSIVLTGTMNFGFFVGSVAELGCSDTSLTATNFANIKAYLNTRYALSL